MKTNLLLNILSVMPLTDLDGAVDNLFDFFYDTILPILYGVVIILGVVLVVFAGLKMMEAGSKGAEEKDAAKKRLLWIAIGVGVAFSAVFLVDVLEATVKGIWG